MKQNVPNNQQKKKKKAGSLFSRVSAWLHLWLGLISGIIMIIVCITGCIWVFNEEITSITEPQHNIPVREQAILPPSAMAQKAAEKYPTKTISYITYREGKAAYVGLGQRRGGTTLRMNPYTGEIITATDAKKGQVDFFRWILNGHRFLWMPYEIGRPIVNYSTLVFIITLITGLVLWWPKKWNKSTRDASFKIKWTATIKRVNYDLHNVLGFYSMIVLLAIGLTGMVWGIQWFSKGAYWLTSGGTSLPAYNNKIASDSTATRNYTSFQAVDKSFHTVVLENPRSTGFYVTFPDTTSGKSFITLIAYPSKGKYYDHRNYAFDQFTTAKIQRGDFQDKSFEASSFGTQLRRMNYDIHVGAVLGLPGKILAFFASLIGATLPVTGFIIWWGKKKKQKKKPAAKQVAKATAERFSS
ncbi:putative iron-regulated membrane protein [Chitinophaga skermanii]|uniref:Putative iron-regulated membrane protein n=1 Tax=Chitinophaga skermanii TaxID=331697 RepID=A0A327Q0J3_9BACT|nr:PepSY-associated TM helix domain-containing protein [Chitinophaga skermanii]RAI97563.1 putative iron-regulated membrane protein [Chitinophaga skermanii]